MKRTAIALLLLLPLTVLSSANELTDSSYEKVRQHVLPSAEEEAWRKIAWRTTFWQGVIDANKEDKPVMLFAMNGHPFGCT